MSKLCRTWLPIAATIGVITTSIFSARGALKVDSTLKEEAPDSIKETIRIAIPKYLPAFISGGLTIAFIFADHSISAKQIAALSSMLIMSERKFRSYRGKIKEILGEEKESEIYAEIAKEQCYLYPELPSRTRTSEDFCELFYDSYSERFFWSSVEQVQQAMYHLNRNFTFRGWSFLNEFYEFLGIDDIPVGDEVGWSATSFLEDGLEAWIDFSSREIVDEKGEKYRIVDFTWDPTREAMGDDYI